MNEREVLEYLSSCSGRSFCELIAAANAMRRSTRKAASDLEERLVLCSAYRHVGTPHPDLANTWEFEAIAPAANPNQYSAIAEPQEYFEQGECPKCRAQLTSYAKSVICPLCGAAAALT